MKKWQKLAVVLIAVAACTVTAIIAVFAGSTSTSTTSTLAEFVPASSSYSCPSGYTYNATYKMCQLVSVSTTSYSTLNWSGYTFDWTTNSYKVSAYQLPPGGGNTCTAGTNYVYTTINNKPSCKLCPPPRSNPSPGDPKTNPPCP